jgi:hypothetical protein
MPQAVVEFVLAISALHAASNRVEADPRQLASDDEKAVRAAAETALKARDLWRGRICLTNTEVLFDNRPSPPGRYALLTFYRYDGDLAILVTIHLDKMTATKVEPHPHMPTSLTLEEIAEAERIARGHPDIKKALARYKHLDKIEVDTNVAQIINPQVPGYQHRVARLFFRDDQRNYLANVPMVDVDLTTGEVRLDLIRGTHDKK